MLKNIYYTFNPVDPHGNIRIHAQRLYDHHSMKRFGEYVVDEGYLTEIQVQECLQRQKETRQPIGEMMVELGYLTELQRDAILQQQMADFNG